MNDLIKILFVAVVVLLIVGCRSSELNKEIAPVTREQIRIDTEKQQQIRKEILLELYRQWRLKQYEKEYLDLENNGKNFNR